MSRIIPALLAAIVLVPFAIIREKLYVKKHREEVDLKKRSAVLWSLRGVLMILLIGFGMLIYKTDYEKHAISTYDHGTYRLAIYEIGTPGFPFGNSHCRLILSKDGRRESSMDVSLANDGKRLSSENFDVRWREDGAAVTSRVEEQDDRTYVLYFDGAGTHVLEHPQEMRANLISWSGDSFTVSVCDPMENTIFPDGAKLTVQFSADTYFIDIDGSVTAFDPDRKFWEPTVGSKLKWVEGMVLQIEFTAYNGYSDGNGYLNCAAARRIENVDVIAVDAD